MEAASYYCQAARKKHPEVKDEQAARVADSPAHMQPRYVNGEYRALLCGFIEEIGKGMLAALLWERIPTEGAL